MKAHRAPALVPAAWILALSAGCDCGGGPSRGPCASNADCEVGQACVDGRCERRTETDAGHEADAARFDAGLDAPAACPSAILCGTPPVCCESGQECVQDRCLPGCASGVRCGSDLTTCCDEGQVCVSAACVDPGERCTDSFECEERQFCEPTLGRCLPQFDPVTCETTPVFGDFAVTLEWSVTSATEAPDCLHAIASPVVVDLDGDRIPEVIASMACDDAWENAVLRAIAGNTGAIRWTAAERLHGRASIAAGDLDADGRPEIVGLARTSYDLLAFRPDGTLLWRSSAPLGSGANNGAPAIADLDSDGTPEVIFGAVVLEGRTGVVRWSRDLGAREGSNGGYLGGIAAVADLDDDGRPEIVTGRRAYRADGTAFWTASVADGYPAIAQFDDDPQPEVVLVAEGNVYCLDGLTGAVQWGPVALPGGGIGGPPTVADFDGDGMPEIGVAGARSYTVYDPSVAGGVLWSQPTEDLSSNATGSSVFDFEGDGAAEVIYADECYMRVYRGRDGAVLLQVPNSTATIHEYPLVADVDGDGNSEIVIVANDRSATIRDQCRAADPGWDGARRGVFVYGDARDQWVRTRRVWNQHTYHVTNVAPDGTIPRAEIANWTVPGLNNYRQNVQGEGVYNAPDLRVLALEVDLSGCPTHARLRARIANEGNLGVPAGVPVAFYRGTVAGPGARIGVVPTPVALLPGATTVVELETTLAGVPPYAFLAVVDDDGMGVGIVTECHEDDNAASIADVDCAVIF